MSLSVTDIFSRFTVVHTNFGHNDRRNSEHAVQSVAESIVAVTMAKFSEKNINKWESSDLDRILEGGDELYLKSCNDHGITYSKYLNSR